MIVLTCVDKNNGMMFNHRRQSQDRAVRKRVEEISSSGTLRMDPYSAKQWKNHLPENAIVSADFLQQAGPEDYCFVEDTDMAPFEDEISELILFRWNRVYPKDTSFPIALNQWNLEDAEEFNGCSHQDITQETYIKATAPVAAYASLTNASLMEENKISTDDPAVACVPSDESQRTEGIAISGKEDGASED